MDCVKALTRYSDNGEVCEACEAYEDGEDGKDGEDGVCDCFTTYNVDEYTLWIVVCRNKNINISKIYVRIIKYLQLQKVLVFPNKFGGGLCIPRRAVFY